ncbi:hypothetical protein [Tahibacter harae]|uniref:Uncharacterized protein n=1 Tax=Tahibacter harae TaxID=2963937 RepID=A0ABT1QTC4_9GAMM|nr:hypothetical protein [Tahibacter harae]MCQ4165540.1 hypothetical protein [Tahibacter harae]
MMRRRGWALRDIVRTTRFASVPLVVHSAASAEMSEQAACFSVVAAVGRTAAWRWAGVLLPLRQSSLTADHAGRVCQPARSVPARIGDDSAMAPMTDKTAR